MSENSIFHVLQIFHSFSVGQVGGVAISAALFQSILNTELHRRIHGDNADEVSQHYRDQSLTTQ